MVVIYDTTVGADGNVDACFFEVFVSCFCYFDNSGSLTTANTFLFSCDTDGTTADTDLDEVSACLSEEAEALSDRIGIMKNGELLATGTVEELNKIAGTNNFEEAFVTIVKEAVT